MMKSESILRSLIINKINSGLTEETARGWLAMTYPEQEGEIWTLELTEPTMAVIDSNIDKELASMADVVQYDDPTEDLDVSILNETTEQNPKLKPTKANLRKVFLASSNKLIGHITAEFMYKFKFPLLDAYHKALDVIADYDKRRIT